MRDDNSRGETVEDHYHARREGPGYLCPQLPQIFVQIFSV
jgi:hypothetical protein